MLLPGSCPKIPDAMWAPVFFWCGQPATRGNTRGRSGAEARVPRMEMGLRSLPRAAVPPSHVAQRRRAEAGPTRATFHERNPFIRKRCTCLAAVVMPPPRGPGLCIGG